MRIRANGALVGLLSTCHVTTWTVSNPAYLNNLFQYCLFYFILFFYVGLGDLAFVKENILIPILSPDDPYPGVFSIKKYEYNRCCIAH